MASFILQTNPPHQVTLLVCLPVIGNCAISVPRRHLLVLGESAVVTICHHRLQTNLFRHRFIVNYYLSCLIFDFYYCSLHVD